MWFSVVIPTYNRAELTCRAIESARSLALLGQEYEIIVVDDASTDDTVGVIRERFCDLIESQVLSVFVNEKNLGASGSKNVGSFKASGEFLIFLDSDDTLIESTLTAVLNRMNENPDVDLFFFRSRNMATGELIGRPIGSESYLIDCAEFINVGTPGECLPIIRRDVFAKFPYETSLRGGEGIAYARMIKSSAKALVVNLVVRNYDMSNEGRLSVGDGFDSRSLALAKNHIVLLREFFGTLSAKRKAKSLVAVFYYSAKYLFWMVKKNIQRL